MSAQQPFAIGDRVVIVANDHFEQESTMLVGRTGKVREVYSYPSDTLMECGVVLDGEDAPRLFLPTALARLDPEADPWLDD